MRVSALTVTICACKKRRKKRKLFSVVTSHFLEWDYHYELQRGENKKTKRVREKESEDLSNLSSSELLQSRG